jgi:hypothetical protein
LKSNQLTSSQARFLEVRLRLSGRKTRSMITPILGSSRQRQEIMRTAWLEEDSSGELEARGPSRYIEDSWFHIQPPVASSSLDRGHVFMPVSRNKS